MKKVNLTIELVDSDEIYRFEKWIKEYVNVTHFQILTDTKELYDSDSYFRQLCKDEKTIKRIKNDYINSKL